MNLTNSEQSTATPGGRRSFGTSPWPWLAFAVVAVTIVLAATFVFWRVETWPARTAGDVAEVFQQAFDFEPQVTIEDRVLIEQSSPVAELAVTEARVVAERDYENRWLLSTKRIRAQATYLAKAGFDLERDVGVSLDREENRLHVEFPPPELLSLDREHVDVLEWDNGLWNRLNGDDTEQVMNELRRVAGQRVADRDLLTESRKAIEDRLVPALEERTGLDVAVTFRS